VGCFGDAEKVIEWRRKKKSGLKFFLGNLELFFITISWWVFFFFFNFVSAFLEIEFILTKLYIIN
jgi:hypothetical protein